MKAIRLSERNSKNCGIVLVVISPSSSSVVALIILIRLSEKQRYIIGYEDSPTQIKLGQDYHSEKTILNLVCTKNTHLKTPFTLPLLLPGRAL